MKNIFDIVTMSFFITNKKIFEILFHLTNMGGHTTYCKQLPNQQML